MLNALQLAELLRLFNTKIPGNVHMFTLFFEDITSFRIYDAELLLSEMMYVPEVDPHSLNFQMAGFHTSLFLINSNSFLLLFTLQFSMFILLLAFHLCARCSNCAGKLKEKLSLYLFWNGSFRLFMEAFLNLTLFAFLNISEMMYELEVLDSVNASNKMSVIFLVLLCLLSLLPLIYTCYQRTLEKISPRIKTYFEGTNKKSPLHVVAIVPCIFFLRRLVLAWTLVYWQEFLWGQVAVQFASSTLVIIFLCWAGPLKSNFFLRLEIFNELT